MRARVFRCVIAMFLLLYCNLAAAAEPLQPRSWQMGFGVNPPRPTVRDVIRGIDSWSKRAELAAIHEELPWRDLLAGMSPEAILDRDKVQLIAYLRSKGLKIFFMADPTDGLDRAQEAPQLRAAGRSLAEPAVQKLYRSYVLAVVRKLQPDYLGLAAETNLIRLLAPSTVYAAVVRAANDVSADLRVAGSKVPLIASIQVEAAWGVLGAKGPYVGVEQDFADFGFMQILGLSSYPYFAYVSPEDIPNDYYRRILQGHTLPAMVLEGGWTSARIGAVRSSPKLQARYVARHTELLDSIQALAVLQLVYADIDISKFPQPLPANLPLFVRIGLATSGFRSKPALGVWDAQHARPLQSRR